MQNEDKLNELDRAAGDGDCGSTFGRGARGRFFSFSIIVYLLKAGNNLTIWLIIFLLPDWIMEDGRLQ